MSDPILYLGSLNVRQETQNPTIGLRHGVDLVIETPVDLPLGEEQLCPLAFSVEYLRWVAHKFGASSSCGRSSTWSNTSSWWASAESSSTSRRSATSAAAAAADGRGVCGLSGGGCSHYGCD